MSKTSISNALIFPDLHSPYHHPDALNFLYRIKEVFGPFDRYYCLGDETDGHSWSYHEPSTTLANPDKEFDMAKEFMRELYEFTEGQCDVMESNHGSLAYRKAKTGKIPSQIMRGAYQRALEAPSGWVWHPELMVKTIRGSVLLHHGFATINTWLVAKDRGHSIVTGHYHTRFLCHSEFLPNINRQIFAAQVGCLIDIRSDAFDYAKGTKEKPKLGAMVLLDGLPMMIPMRLDEYGRWVGTL